jgi:AcrR family transcriptional regulator
VTVTPWGRAERLRTRQVRPGSEAPRAAVERNQRERLFGGMVVAVTEYGYEETRVEDVLNISGVSRNTFYKRFDNKQACFLATVEAILDLAMERVAAAYGRDGPWNLRLGAAFEAAAEMIISQPAAARLCFVEMYAAGPEAIDLVDRKARELEGMVMLAFKESPERAGIPRELVRAGIGGLRKIARTRLRLGREEELMELAPDLLEWALCYRTPPRPLRKPRKPLPLPPAATEVDLDDPRERVLMGLNAAVAEQGYPAATLADVARHASISLSTFYAHFDGKEEAMLAALQRSSARSLAATLPAYRAGEDWPHAIGRAFEALFSFIASEPAMCSLGAVDAYAGGPPVLELRDCLNEAARTFLDKGYRDHPDTPAAAAEAVSASVDALLFERLRSMGAERMYEAAPQATYLTLVPFIGAEAACEVANAGGRSSAASASTRPPARRPRGKPRRTVPAASRP